MARKWMADGSWFAQAVLWGLMLVAVLAGCGEERPQVRYAHLFPEAEEIRGIDTRSEIAEYADSSLYDFLNGGAELYFDYGIVAVASAGYSLGEERCIEVSIYRMGSGEDAFGIYSMARYPGADVVEIGNGGMRTGGSVDFWKGAYYCRVISFETSPEAGEAALALAGAVAERIDDSGSPPGILMLMPEDGLIPTSAKYFRTQLALNNIRYIDAVNVLMLSEGTEGCTGEYGNEGEGFAAFLIRYPTFEQAQAAYASYKAHLAGQGEVGAYRQVEAARTDADTFTLMALHDDYVLGVWEARDIEAGYGFIERAAVLIDTRSE